jgi:staphylococcal nuclease domain-containing protein 1
MSHPWHRLYGTVAGILSGDSLIVRFDSGQNVAPVQIISLEHLIAPKFGSPDGQIPDDPWGFESWNFLRNLCIGARVAVNAPNRKTEMARSHPAFGRLPLFFSRVSLAPFDTNDIGLRSVTDGWIRIRAPKIRDFYVESLYTGEARARQSRLGVWQGDGQIRRLPVAFRARDLISIGEFDAIVDSVVNGTTLSVFLVPNHEHLIFRVAACRSPSAKKETSDRYGIEAKEFTIFALLHRSIRIRLLSCNENDLFIGPILDRSDSVIRDLISAGLAQVNVHTADLTPSSVEYERCECEAKARRVKLWENEPIIEQIPLSFEGIVTQIVSSCSIRVDCHGDARLVQLTSMKTSVFIAGGGSEPYGFETRERLRQMLIGQLVTVVVDGILEKRFYGTVMLDDVCVNTAICRAGLAQIVDPMIGRPSSRIGEMTDASRQAAAGKAGLFAAVEPVGLQIVDLSGTMYSQDAMTHFQQLRGTMMRGIVEQILGGNRFVVLVPEHQRLLRLALNGLLPISPSDPYGRHATEFALGRYLNRDIEFDVHEVDKSGGFLANMYLLEHGARTNIAQELLFQGLAEVHKRTVRDIPNFDELLSAQVAAQDMRMGKWSGSRCEEVELEFEKFYPVRVVEVRDAVTLVVQFMQSAMREIFVLLVSATTPATASVGELVCVAIEATRYRARVVSVGPDQSIRVHLVDYDADVSVQARDIFELPLRLIPIEPQAVTVRLAFLKDEQKTPTDRKFVKRVTSDVEMFMRLAYLEACPAVFLFDKPELEAGTLNALVLGSTSVVLDHVDLDLDDELIPILDLLKSVVKPPRP